MQDEKNHTPTQRTRQMTHAEIVAGIRKVIATKLTHRDLEELKSYINGLLRVATPKEKADG